MTTDTNTSAAASANPYIHTDKELVPCIRPRRQIGPDALMMLRHVSKYNTGDKFAYDHCKVQRHENGTPSWNLEFDSMEYVGHQHPDSYGYLIGEHLIPLAKRKVGFLSKQEPSVIEWELSVLLKKARGGDGFSHWLLSTAALRSFLFPNSYQEGRRIDRVLYIDRPNDLTNRGQVAKLASLKPREVASFTSYVSHLINEEFDVTTITPLQTKSVFLKGRNDQ
jgi:hypothetical protein